MNSAEWPEKSDIRWGESQEVLKKRYAKGEITKQIFDSVKRDIEE